MVKLVLMILMKIKRKSISASQKLISNQTAPKADINAKYQSHKEGNNQA